MNNIADKSMLTNSEPVATPWLQYVRLILVQVLGLQIKQAVNYEY